MQNKCVRFCLQLDSRSYIGTTELNQINLFPVSEKINHYISILMLLFFNENYPLYLHDLCKSFC